MKSLRQMNLVADYGKKGGGEFVWFAARIANLIQKQ